MANLVEIRDLKVEAKTDAGRWRWLGVGRPTKFPDNTDVLVTGIPSTRSRYSRRVTGFFSAR